MDIEAEKNANINQSGTIHDGYNPMAWNSKNLEFFKSYALNP